LKLDHSVDDSALLAEPMTTIAFYARLREAESLLRYATRTGFFNESLVDLDFGAHVTDDAARPDYP